MLPEIARQRHLRRLRHIVGQPQDQRQAPAETQSLPLAAGEPQRHVLEKRRLPRARLAQQHQAGLVGQQLEDRRAPAGFPAGSFAVAVHRRLFHPPEPPPSSAGRTQLGMKRYVHFGQGQPQRKVFDRDPLELQILRILAQRGEIGRLGAVELGRIVRHRSGRGQEKGQRREIIAHGAIGLLDRRRPDRRERLAASVDQGDVSHPPSQLEANRPDPADLPMGQQLQPLVSRQLRPHRRGASAGLEERPAGRNHEVCADEVVHQPGAVEKHDFLAAVLFLVESGFGKPGERNEVPGRPRTPHLRQAGELVDGVATDRRRRGFAFGEDLLLPVAQVDGDEVDLAPGKMNVFSRDLVPLGDEEIAHQIGQKIAVARRRDQQADGRRRRHRKSPFEGPRQADRVVAARGSYRTSGSRLTSVTSTPSAGAWASRESAVITRAPARRAKVM